MGDKVVYLDHAAATPLDERVFAVMQPYMDDVFYNPSSPYSGGLVAKRALEDAREGIAKTLGAKPNDVVFTAGATESINLALGGLLKHGGHAVIGATEHASVRSAVSSYPHSIATCDSKGIVNAASIKRVVTDETVVVSVALADSEFGVLQPLSDIAAMIEIIRQERHKRGVRTPLYLHSDGSQGSGTVELKVSRLGVDLLTLNAAKCYGPKQVGLLWLKPHIELSPLFAGGGQEKGLRGGTENVAGAVGFALALEIAQQKRHSERVRLSELRQVLVDELNKGVGGIVINGHPKRHIPGHLHVHVPGLDAERVVYRLDMEGIYIATGAACAANKGTRSPSLIAIGLTPEEADGSLRITLGALSTKEDIVAAAPRIVAAIEQERGL